MKAFFKRDRVIFYLTSGTLTVFAIFDIYEDFLAQEGILQIFSEALLFAFAIFGISVLLKKNLRLKNEITSVRSELSSSNSEALKWKTEQQLLLQGLGQAIDKQFSTWHLSSSETEIALLLLKGLSFKEIAEIRGTNEKTVRQQSVKVYEKSGLNGRSELSAFFLEDILLPKK